MWFCLYLTIYGIIYLKSNSITLFTKYGEGGFHMKRMLSIILILVLTTLSLTGCGFRKNSPESLIGEFISEMYNVKDYKKIDLNKLTWDYPKDDYTNAIGKLSTKDALDTFAINRYQLEYITYCCKLHVNSEVISKKINQYTTKKDGSIVYTYNGKVKLTFTDENKQEEEDINGQITVNKIDNKWIITKFNYVSVQSILKYYIKSIQ